MKEKYFENKVKHFLKENGAWYVKYWGGGYTTTSGIPDILVCFRGRFYGIEIKADSGRPTMLQLVTLEEIRKAGGFGILLYPKDWEGFQDWLIHMSSDYHDPSYWYRGNTALQEDWKRRLYDSGSKEDN